MNTHERNDGISDANERMRWAAQQVALTTCYLELSEASIIGIESAASADPSAENVERARTARALLEDTRRDLVDAKTVLASVQREVVMVEGMAIEATEKIMAPQGRA